MFPWTAADGSHRNRWEKWKQLGDLFSPWKLKGRLIHGSFKVLKHPSDYSNQTKKTRLSWLLFKTEHVSWEQNVMACLAMTAELQVLQVLCWGSADSESCQTPGRWKGRFTLALVGSRLYQWMGTATLKPMRGSSLELCWTDRVCVICTLAALAAVPQELLSVQSALTLLR